MQDEGPGYIIARILNAIFKKRPIYAYVVFSFLIVIFLSFLLITAQKPEELIFPIIGLVFVLIVMVAQIIQAVRSHGIEEKRGTEQTLLSQGYAIQQESPILLEDSPSQESPSQMPVASMISTPILKPGASTSSTPIPKPAGSMPSDQIVLYHPFLLVVCIFSFALGFVSTPLIVLNILPARFISQIVQIWSADLFEVLYKDVLFQLVCSLPCSIFSFIPILGLLLYIYNRFSKGNTGTIPMLYAISSFILGMAIYLPIQMITLFLISF